jgi:hypothetical protein
LAGTLDSLFDWDEADISRFDFRQAAIDLDAPGFSYLVLLLASKNMISQ